MSDQARHAVTAGAWRLTSEARPGDYLNLSVAHGAAGFSFHVKDVPGGTVFFDLLMVVLREVRAGGDDVASLFRAMLFDHLKSPGEEYLGHKVLNKLMGLDVDEELSYVTMFSAEMRKLQGYARHLRERG